MDVYGFGERVVGFIRFKPIDLIIYINIKINTPSVQKNRAIEV